MLVLELGVAILSCLFSNWDSNVGHLCFLSAALLMEELDLPWHSLRMRTALNIPVIVSFPQANASIQWIPVPDNCGGGDLIYWCFCIWYYLLSQWVRDSFQILHKFISGTAGKKYNHKVNFLAQLRTRQSSEKQIYNSFSINESVYNCVILNYLPCLDYLTYPSLLSPCVAYQLQNCQDPFPFPNGDIINSDYSAGQSITFQCYAGYVLIGHTVLTCLHGINRKWNHPFPRCEGKNDFLFLFLMLV